MQYAPLDFCFCTETLSYFFICVAVAGVSKVVTVDIKGNWQRWLKVRDLTKGVTYLFRVQARTIAYGPELQANITAGPAEGEGDYKSKS